MLAVCCSKVRKVSRWSSFDHVLDLGDNLLKNLRLNGYLDAPDLPGHLNLYGYLCDINKVYLHDGEATVGSTFLLYPFLPTGRRVALSFINGTVTAKIFHAHSYYFFDCHSKNSRDFSVSNAKSVFLKFSSLQ